MILGLPAEGTWDIPVVFACNFVESYLVPHSENVHDDIALAAEFFIFFCLCTIGILTNRYRRLREAWAHRRWERLWHRTCKTRRFQTLWHRTCKTRHFQRLFDFFLQNMKIWLKITIGNRQVGGRFSKNRPTCCDFEFFFPDPQLHQTFKPIRELLCTFSSCSVLSINMIYNIYKFQEK